MGVGVGVPTGVITWLPVRLRVWVNSRVSSVAASSVVKFS